jgi:predicted methyltransferase
MNTKLIISTMFIAALVIGCGDTGTSGQDGLLAAANGDHRSADNIKRNSSRHSVETLKFFGITSDMTVMEIWPGSGGWYTEILAPYLREQGTFYAASYVGDKDTPYFIKGVEKFEKKLAANPTVYDKVKSVSIMPPAHIEPAPEGSVDLILSFRNLHNWVNNDMADEMFRAFFKALKPGGVLGVVAHRAKPETIGLDSAKTGYLAESEAIKIAETAGFVLSEKSQLNANPKDTKDYPDGVWTLPPNYKKGEVDKAKYEAIGESDRMTLKFSKPL